MGIFDFFGKNRENLSKDSDTYSNYYSNALKLWDFGTASFRDPSQAIMFLNKAISQNPTKEEAYSSRGSAYVQLKKYKLAIEDFNKAILVNPTNISNYLLSRPLKN